jgi:hypothetical protein
VIEQCANLTVDERESRDTRPFRVANGSKGGFWYFVLGQPASASQG